MQSVRTDLTKGDIVRAVIVKLTRPAILFKAWTIWMMGVAALIAFAEGAPEDANGFLVLLVSASVGAIAAVAVSIAFMAVRALLALNPRDGVLGEHLYELREEGLHEKTKVNETLATWPGVSGVLKTESFAFIEMRSGSFHIIPTSSFHSAQHEQDFISEVVRRASSDA